MSGNKKQILVAEDNAALARVVSFNLERAGFHVTIANNGRDAWELAQESPFDLILTDQQMPEMTGVELCRLLRGHASYTHTPIIMLTAKGLELELPRLRAELGIAATYIKPFSPKDILQAVDEQLAAVC